MYVRQGGPLLASDVMVTPPTLIQYFPLSPELALSPVKLHRYSTAVQLRSLYLHLDLKGLVLHHSRRPSLCLDTHAVVTSKRFRVLSLSVFWQGKAIGCSTHM